MKQFVVLALIIFAPLATSGHELVRVKKPELATVLGLLEELATTKPDSDQPHIVRIYAVPTRIGECGGAVSSCPDVRLFFTVSVGDLGEEPVLYQLPVAKGWEFAGWTSPVTKGNTSMSSFMLRTTLPDANVALAARKAWRSQEYRVLVSPAAASYVRR